MGFFWVKFCEGFFGVKFLWGFVRGLYACGWSFCVFVALCVVLSTTQTKPPIKHLSKHPFNPLLPSTHTHTHIHTHIHTHTHTYTHTHTHTHTYTHTHIHTHTHTHTQKSSRPTWTQLGAWPSRRSRTTNSSRASLGDS